MDIMPCLREQNPQQNQGGYYSDKLSSLLPEMQAGKLDRSEKFTNNSHHRARRKDAEPYFYSYTLYLCLQKIAEKERKYKSD